MLAFAESGRKEDLVALLDLLDLSKVSGSKYIYNIFKALGRLELENYAEKLLQGMRSKGNKLCASSPYLVHISLYVNKMDTSNILLAENLSLNWYFFTSKYCCLFFSFIPFVVYLKIVSISSESSTC